MFGILNINLQQVDTQQHNKINVQPSNSNSISNFINHFQDVFTAKVGCIRNFEISLQLRQGAKLVFYKELEVPFPSRERVERELDELEQSGIISKCERSGWGSPLIIIPKSDGGVKLCVDSKN